MNLLPVCASLVSNVVSIVHDAVVMNNDVFQSGQIFHGVIAKMDDARILHGEKDFGSGEKGS